jgi:pyroglutamyl-peptidase
MPRILLTAFEPYDEWRENSSWLALVELTRYREFGGQVVTRRYPVHLERMTERLGQDLQSGFDFAIHLGQAPGAVDFKFETVGLNLDSQGRALRSDGPLAYRSPLPLHRWSDALRERGIPAGVSYHAGTYLCNALLYLSCHLSTVGDHHTQSAFIHLPLASQQVCQSPRSWASLSLPMLAAGISTVLDQLNTDTGLSVA